MRHVIPKYYFTTGQRSNEATRRRNTTAAAAMATFVEKAAFQKLHRIDAGIGRETSCDRMTFSVVVVMTRQMSSILGF